MARQSGPGEVGQTAGDDVGVERRLVGDQPPADAFRQADQPVRDRALMVGIDVDGDERGDRLR